MYTKSAMLVCLMLAASIARASIVLDQSQLVYGSGAAIGVTNQRLAQTFRVGVDGRLVYVKLSVACYSEGSYRVVVSLHTVGADGLPTATVLDSRPLDSSMLPGFGDHTLTAVPLSASVTRGEELAIVLSPEPENAECEAYSSAGGDVYPDGSFTFQADPNPPGWVPTGGDRDLVFQTFVDNGAAPGLCQFRTADGSNNDWVPNDVPVCRCLEDRALAAQRCAFMLPNAIVFSELPLNAVSKIRARWSVEPLIDPGMPTTIGLKSLNGDLSGKTVTINARKPMYSKTIRAGYSATSPKALDQTIVTIDNDGHSFQFENIRLPQQ